MLPLQRIQELTAHAQQRFAVRYIQAQASVVSSPPMRLRAKLKDFEHRRKTWHNSHAILRVSVHVTTC
eukprot:4911019-Amphidinium_carterae.1